MFHTFSTLLSGISYIFFCESYIRIQNIWPLKNRKWQCVIFLNFKMVSERLYLEGQKGKKFALIMTENQRNLLLSPHIGFILQNGKKKNVTNFLLVWKGEGLGLLVHRAWSSPWKGRFSLGAVRNWDLGITSGWEPPDCPPSRVCAHACAHTHIHIHTYPSVYMSDSMICNICMTSLWGK